MPLFKLESPEDLSSQERTLHEYAARVFCAIVLKPNRQDAEREMWDKHLRAELVGAFYDFRDTGSLTC